ncbi:MAG TPA: hypothetical protein PLQ00_17555, partial [Thermoguttaceae bacterium]|nr:hypothetical protein [Thermoguttaceae bacterium]
MFEYFYHRNGKPLGHFHVLNRETGQTVFADRVDLTSREARAKLLPVLASITKEAPGTIEQTLLELAVREEERAVAQRAARQRPEQPPASAPKWEPGSEARKEAEKLLERQDLL